MMIDAPLSARPTMYSRRDEAREAAAQYLTSRAEGRRDSRVEEAKALSAQRPTVAERAPRTQVETEERPRSKPTNGTGRLVDVVA